MFNSAPAVLNLKRQSRALAAVLGPLDSNHEHDHDRHLFLSASFVLQDDANQVQLLEYQEDTGQLVEKAAFAHVGEVSHVAPRPHDASHFFTTTTSGGDDLDARSRKAVLWRMDTDAAASSENSELKRAAEVPLDASSGLGNVNAVAWEPEETDTASARVAVVRDGGMQVCAVEDDCSIVSQTSSVELLSLLDNRGTDTHTYGGVIRAVSWDPHHANQVSLAAADCVVGVDVRSMKPTYCVSGAHGSGGLAVRDIDYNPNKPHHMVSGGDDGRVKFWDSRKTDTPIKVLAPAHAHWVTQAKYNRFHDQLILTSGTDSIVNLWRMSSISSAPLLDLDDDDDDHHLGFGRPEVEEDTSSEGEGIAKARDAHDGSEIEGFDDYTSTDSPGRSAWRGGGGGGGEQQRQQRLRAKKEEEDTCIRKLEGHEDSVCSVAWSASDAWVFASLSHNGQVIVNHVPSAEKYKILL